MKKYLVILLLSIVITNIKAQQSITESFETGGFNSPFISLEVTGAFSSPPGVVEKSNMGGSYAFSFGKSVCGSSCFGYYKTSLVISFPYDVHVESMGWKEMEIDGNWGSQGQIFIDGVALPGVELGAQPVNSRVPDATPRNISINIDKSVRTIRIEVSDITSSSQILIDDLEIKYSVDPMISGYEYWFNDDFENKQIVSVNGTEELTIDENIKTDGLTNGVNVFNFRSFDNLGKYSSITSQYFYKTPEKNFNETRIVGYEYWFNDDFENRLKIKAQSTDELSLNTNISTDLLKDGVNILNFRSYDSNHKYSSIVRQYFYKVVRQTFDDNAITGYRYWFDDDFENAAYKDTDNQNEFELIDNIDLSRIPKGTHTINIQFRDVNDKWSVVLTDSFDKLPLPVADFEYSVAPDCEVTTVTFTSKSIDGDEYLWNFGDGNTSTLENPSHDYTTTGTYNVSLTITENSTGKQSTRSVPVDITVNTIDVTVIQDGNSLRANAVADHYQWLDCDKGNTPVEGETAQQFIAAKNGNYAVEITLNGCVAISDCYSITSVGINDNTFSNSIKVYPNPTDGLLKLEVGEAQTGFTVHIFDVNGKLIFKSVYANTKHAEIDLNEKPGIYFMDVVSDNKKATVRIIKR